MWYYLLASAYPNHLPSSREQAMVRFGVPRSVMGESANVGEPTRLALHVGDVISAERMDRRSIFCVYDSSGRRVHHELPSSDRVPQYRLNFTDTFYVGHLHAGGYGQIQVDRWVYDVRQPDSPSAPPSLSPPPRLSPSAATPTGTSTHDLQEFPVQPHVASSPSPMRPPPPVLPPFSPQVVSQRYATWRHRLHTTGMVVAIGILFPTSVLLVHYAHGLTHMFRKAVHATLQILGVVLIYAAAVPMTSLSNEGPPIRRVHRIWGYALLYGGIPLVLVTRLPPLKRWHVDVGHVVLFALSVQCAIGAALKGQTALVVFTGVLTVFYAVYSIHSWLTRYPSVSDLVRREADGAYTVIPSTPTHVVAIGSDWSSYLSKAICTQTQLFTRRLSGAYGGGRWGAGTTVGTLQAQLAKEGKTLPSHPSVLGATLGAWAFTASHGGGGTRWKACLGRTTVWDTHAGRVFEVPHPERVFHDHTTIEAQRRYVVLDVCVLPVANDTCYQTAFCIETSQDAHRFLHEDTYARLVFVDKHSALCFLWTAHQTTPLSRWGALFPPWIFGSKLLPRWLTCWVPLRIWNRRMTLRSANHFAPDPPYWTGLVAYAYTNVELFVKIRLTAKLLAVLCDSLRSMLCTSGGRCEVRYEGDKLFLDFAIVGSRHYRGIFRALARVLPQGTRVSLHKGKYQTDTSPLPRTESSGPH